MPMDADWLAVIADRDYLFPLAWPVDVWVTNLIAVPVIWWLGRLPYGHPRRLKLVTATIVVISLAALAVAVTH